VPSGTTDRPPSSATPPQVALRRQVLAARGRRHGRIAWFGGNF